MKQAIITLCFLVSLISCDRFIYSAITPDKETAFIVSSKNIPGVSNSDNNIFVYAMGHHIPLANINTPPFAAVLAADGYIDYTSQLSFSASDFNGVAAAFAFLYFGIGEYCEGNGIPGYQQNSADTVIQYKNYTQTTFANIVGSNTGNVYSASLADTSGLFTLNCRASVNTRNDSGLTLGPYDVKCDVIVNATNFWAASTTCSDKNRYLGVIVYLAAASVNTSTLKSPVDSTGQNGFYTSTKNAYFKYMEQVNVDGPNAGIYNVTADIMDVTENFPGLPSSISQIQRIIFSFLSPKSNGGNVYSWDPNLGVADTVLGSSSTIFVSFWLMFASIVIAVFM